MPIKTVYYRTYIARLRTPKGVFYYGGQHKSYNYDAKLDRYKGSGTRLWNLYRKYGFGQIRWLNEFRTLGQVNIAEISLISNLRSKHENFCVNIESGGNCGARVWTEDDKLAHKEILNKESVKAKMRSSQKIAQNRIERRARQSEIMKDLYANGLSDVVSKRTSEAQRKAPHWSMPLKKKIFDKWIELGQPKQGALAKSISDFYVTTGSKLKLLVYEFIDKGLVV